jgi:hypothetical protein
MHLKKLKNGAPRVNKWCALDEKVGGPKLKHRGPGIQNRRAIA